MVSLRQTEIKPTAKQVKLGGFPLLEFSTEPCHIQQATKGK